MTCPYVNSSAKTWTYKYATDISLAQRFHQRLPNYEITPLVRLQDLAQELGVNAVFAKDESSRMGLPAFKILGASWGTYRAIAAKTNLPLHSTLEELSHAARQAGLSLFAATSGNHGRAIAYMARTLGIPAFIFLADGPDQQVLEKIANEGAKVFVVEGNYDDAVAEAIRQSQKTPGGLHVQDYSWEGYEEVAGWVVEGYSTMMREIEQQLQELEAGPEARNQKGRRHQSTGLKATHIICPIGAGSLGLAAVAHAKSEGRKISVLTVEPETAACLNHNLKQDRLETIPTGKTIMTGLICGNVNRISWPVLREGVDVSLTITDRECHEAIQWLQGHNVNAGPCGAATLVALRKAANGMVERIAAGLDQNSVVVLLSTEGKRYYKIPE